MQQIRVRARRLRHDASDAERHLWRFLRRGYLGGFRFRRQHPLAGYIVDFACPAAWLIVELDGGQHLEQAAYDAERTRKLESQGYRVLRFWNDEVLLRTEDVLAEILRQLESGA
jgi:very-short-patch-repair endonuclease